ncbi:MAG: DUF4384 domain-containing protein, partial [Cyanobacteria bacterium HKST-UBA02]|nr:DUF4384 domain-containing protein [Cyanobacteria bacterium HKST-UBA02]
YLDPVNKARANARAQAKEEAAKKAELEKTAAVKTSTKSSAKTATAKTSPSKSTVKTATAKIPTSKSSKSTPKTATANTSTPKSTSNAVSSQPAEPSVVVPATYDNNEQIIRASLNKPGTSPHYRHGEKLKVLVSAIADCNVLVFNYDGTVLTQIFPNACQKDPLVKAGTSVEIGGARSNFDFQVSNTEKEPSNEKIFVYAYPVKASERPISLAMNTVASTPFRSTNMSLDDYRKLVKDSRVFFSRSVKVVPKHGVKPASYEQGPPAPNKIELSLTIESQK